MKLPPLTFAAKVTRKHGEIFADEFIDHCTDAGMEAFDRTKLLEWPDDEEFTPAQKHYQLIAEEIAGLTIGLLRQRIAETFVAVAGFVFDRERGR